jgi:hypothetical protein
MKRMWIAAVLALVVAAVAATPAGAATDNDFAVGGGTTSDGVDFAFSAHRGPNGVSGYAKLKLPTGDEVQGHVCSYGPVGGPNATTTEFFIVAEKASGNFQSFQAFQFIVTDGGNPSSGAPDTIRFSGTSSCGFGGVAPTRTVAQGNIVVKNR